MFPPTTVLHVPGTCTSTCHQDSFPSPLPTPYELSLVVTPKQYPPEPVLRYIEELGYYATRVRHSGSTIYLATREVPAEDHFTVYTPRTLCSGSAPSKDSPSSDAKYRLRFSVPFFGVYAQILRRKKGTRYAQTSSHYHMIQKESWIITKGHGRLFTRSREAVDTEWVSENLRTGMVVTITTNVEHQLQTDDYLATCLVMSGHPKGICADDHHFVKPPPRCISA